MLPVNNKRFGLKQFLKKARMIFASRYGAVFLPLGGLLTGLFVRDSVFYLGGLAGAFIGYVFYYVAVKTPDINPVLFFCQRLRYAVAVDLITGLKNQFPNPPRVLDVGSGNYGLGSISDLPFVGCDMAFDGPMARNMISASSPATQLPYRDGEFDVVICLDTLEHINDPDERIEAIREITRVSRTAVIVGGPFEKEAFQADKELSDYFEERRMEVPVWLKEHLANGFPEKSHFENIFSSKGAVKIVRNESIFLHKWLIKRVQSCFWMSIFGVFNFLGKTGVDWVRRFDSVNIPAYRHIFLVVKSNISSRKKILEKVGTYE